LVYLKYTGEITATRSGPVTNVLNRPTFFLRENYVVVSHNLVPPALTSVKKRSRLGASKSTTSARLWSEKFLAFLPRGFRDETYKSVGSVNTNVRRTNRWKEALAAAEELPASCCASAVHQAARPPVREVEPQSRTAMIFRLFERCAALKMPLKVPGGFLRPSACRRLLNGVPSTHRQWSSAGFERWFLDVSRAPAARYRPAF